MLRNCYLKVQNTLVEKVNLSLMTGMIWTPNLLRAIRLNLSNLTSLSSTSISFSLTSWFLSSSFLFISCLLNLILTSRSFSWSTLDLRRALTSSSSWSFARFWTSIRFRLHLLTASLLSSCIRRSSFLRRICLRRSLSAFTLSNLSFSISYSGRRLCQYDKDYFLI